MSICLPGLLDVAPSPPFSSTRAVNQQSSPGDVSPVRTLFDAIGLNHRTHSYLLRRALTCAVCMVEGTWLCAQGRVAMHQHCSWIRFDILLVIFPKGLHIIVDSNGRQGETRRLCIAHDPSHSLYSKSPTYIRRITCIIHNKLRSTIYLTLIQVQKL